MKNFKSIPIDNEEISQSELNIDNKTRSNLFLLEWTVFTSIYRNNVEKIMQNKIF